MKQQIPIVLKPGGDRAYAEQLTEHLQTALLDTLPDAPVWLSVDADGLSLTDGEQAMCGDFMKLQKRLQYHNLTHELLVKAAKVKGRDHLRIIDATAGMGEDSLLLAAAGCEVTLCEQDPVIAALLMDAMRRAHEEPALHDIVARMQLMEGDSIEHLHALAEAENGHPDVIYLDPMFPERQKSGLVKKKFQLIHYLESPAENEDALMQAAIAARPFKIVVKRPAKGPYLAGQKPSYSLDGKAIRYDCYVYPENA